MEIRLFNAELFHADTRTHKGTDEQADTMKLRVAFGNFAKTPKNRNEIRPYISYL
jgi:hypothetical protein